jgi:hypothetical protein
MRILFSERPRIRRCSDEAAISFRTRFGKLRHLQRQSCRNQPSCCTKNARPGACRTLQRRAGWARALFRRQLSAGFSSIRPFLTRVGTSFCCLSFRRFGRRLRIRMASTPEELPLAATPTRALLLCDPRLQTSATRIGDHSLVRTDSNSGVATATHDARNSRTPLPNRRRSNVRKVTPSAYPTCSAMRSMASLLVLSRWTARSIRRS